ncbi:hypothetical protein JHK85_000767 [Glycine max]|nr:hypothetical protein JHK85_000767 [Glycine max]KAG5088134.1 hypothetical protein JHK86_000746 [Glycine max]
MSAVVAGSSSSMSATFTTRRSPFLKNSQEDKDEDEDEDVHLAPDSADDAPRTIPQQGSSEQVNVVPSRPSAHIVGIINKNWHSPPKTTVLQAFKCEQCTGPPSLYSN